MKTQRRSFQVETKRGTSRSAFISQVQEPDVFRKAEAQLFGTMRLSDTGASGTPLNEAIPPRRILRAIEEPQAPLLPSSYDPPGPRGRKPGSRNKPKALDALIGRDTQSGVDGGREAPERRGRPPGSKSPPKGLAPSHAQEAPKSPSAKSPEPWEGDLDEGGPLTAFDTPLPPRRGRPPGSRNKPKDALAISLSKKDRSALDAVGVTADELAIVTSPTEEPRAKATLPMNVASKIEATPDQPQRQRLRERSRIIRRYVLGIKPKPGERKTGLNDS